MIFTVASHLVMSICVTITAIDVPLFILFDWTSFETLNFLQYEVGGNGKMKNFLNTILKLTIETTLNSSWNFVFHVLPPFRKKSGLSFFWLCLCWNWLNFKTFNFLGNGTVMLGLIFWPFLKLKNELERL